VHVDAVVHCIQPKLLAVVDEDAARLVRFDGEQRVSSETATLVVHNEGRASSADP
jgi:hypothetical protein